MTDRHTVDTLTSDLLDQLYDRLAKAEHEAARLTQAHSADAAAGSYAMRAEEAEAFITAVADTIGAHEGDEWAAHPGTTALRTLFAARARPQSVANDAICDAYQPPTTQAESGICARCGMYDYKHQARPAPSMTVRPATVDTRTWTGTRDDQLADWLGGHFAGWDGDQLAVTDCDGNLVHPKPGWQLTQWPDGILTVSSPLAGTRLLELAATIDRVRALNEQWVKAGPPPLGASMARWWDRRLAELHTALDLQELS